MKKRLFSEYNQFDFRVKSGSSGILELEDNGNSVVECKKAQATPKMGFGISLAEIRRMREQAEKDKETEEEIERKRLKDEEWEQNKDVNFTKMRLFGASDIAERYGVYQVLLDILAF